MAGGRDPRPRVFAPFLNLFLGFSSSSQFSPLFLFLPPFSLSLFGLRLFSVLFLLSLSFLSFLFPGVLGSRIPFLSLFFPFLSSSSSLAAPLLSVSRSFVFAQRERGRYQAQPERAVSACTESELSLFGSFEGRASVWVRGLSRDGGLSSLLSSTLSRAV